MIKEKFLRKFLEESQDCSSWDFNIAQDSIIVNRQNLIVSTTGLVNSPLEQPLARRNPPNRRVKEAFPHI